MADYNIAFDHPFVNPYNFVPVDLKNINRPGIVEDRKELLTGYMVCHMKARTYLAVPDVVNKKDTETEKHFKYPFIGMDQGQPYIPASSVRGVVRNVYETITDSCFGTMKKDTVITARTKDPFLPGLLIKEDEEWKLYKAKRHLVVTDARFHRNHNLASDNIQLYNFRQLKNESGNLFWYELAHDQNGNERGHDKEIRNTGRYIYIGTYVKAVSKTEKSGWSTGYLCIGESAPRRHFQGMFEKGSIENEYGTIQEADFIKLETVLKVYRNDRVNNKYLKQHNGYPDYERMKENGVIPVYYQVENGKLYMSFAALGRKAFNKMMNDVAFEKSHQRCNVRTNLCPACSLFGTVEGEGLGSRIRFTDAQCIGFTKEQLVENVVFGELGSPRVSYLPFYLRTKNNNADYRNGYDAESLEIRGRKFYWHHEPELAPKQAIPVNERNGTFDVLTPNTEFKFQIYFDGITETQLELLMAAVHLNDNHIDGNKCHKIGHGKPLGYGSIKMTVDSCTLRKFDMDDGWREIPYDVPNDNISWPCSQETAEALKIICDIASCERFGDAEVGYPGIITDGLSDSDRENLKRNDTAKHKWFTENYKVGDKRPKRSLPEIKDSVSGVDNTACSGRQGNIPLFRYKIVPEENGQNGGRFNNRPDNRQDNGGQRDRRTGVQSDGRSGRIDCRAKIVSSGIPGKNKGYMEYEIEILGNDNYSSKKCKLSTSNRNILEVGQEVEVTLYRGTIFNLKR